MASTNQSPFYQRAEQEFLEAKTDEERIACLEIMIKECPKHKSSENMLKNLTSRLKKLRDGVERKKKSSGGNKKGIKKADMQCVLCGIPNSGKSTIFNMLTNKNAESKVSPHPFTTYEPTLGTMEYQDVQIQIIDDAPIPNHDKSLVNATDTLLMVIDDLSQIKDIEKATWKSRAHKIIILNLKNKTDNSLRKIEAKLKSEHKDLEYLIISNQITTNEINQIKKEIFKTFPVIRVYTKEPGKQKSKEPMILKPESTIKEVAEKILKGMSKNIKQTRIWGPSSKFGGQSVGIEHTLKDKDVIEFKIK